MLRKEYLKFLSDKNIRVGVEFEFIIPNISSEDKDIIKKWEVISIAYYEFEKYEEQLMRYNDLLTKKIPKVPKYASDLGFQDGDVIPDPADVMRKPTKHFNFKRVVNSYLYTGNWPIVKPIIVADNTYKKRNRWIIKPDYSIGSDGFEIVSPIMTLYECVDMLPKMFECIESYGKTDKTCGLHFNISLNNVENLREVIDTEKLVSFIDEKLIYKLFPRRKNNTHAQSMHRDLKSNLKYLGELKSSYGHGMAIDFDHLLGKNKYIEFRYIGGSNYHKRLKDIKIILGMYIYALKMSVNKKDKREYEKRINRIINI